MDRYRLRVTLDVEVEAFDRDDAEIVIADYLGPGPMDSVIQIVKTTVTNI
jgi:hypothetical protein